MSTKIEWTDEPWNIITGCTPISPGCEHCYAKRMSPRLQGRHEYPQDKPFRPGTFHENQLERPLHWRKPRRVFVSTMGDLFHEAVKFSDIDKVMDIIHQTPQHTYQLLTKRPANMHAYFTEHRHTKGFKTVPEHVWLGVTAENHATADSRIPQLLAIPARVRFVSVEPMLERVELGQYLGENHINWVICGGESGQGARPINIEWVRALQLTCEHAGVPFFFKQWGGPNKKKAGKELDGKIWMQMPNVQ